MKAIQNLAKDNVKNLKPCPHGAEVYGAAAQYGIQPQEILDFSSSVNPLGPSAKALEAAKTAFSTIAAYPDSYSNILREVIASRHPGITKDNIVVGNGSTELMYLFAEAFLKKGEKALMSTKPQCVKQVNPSSSSGLPVTSKSRQKPFAVRWRGANWFFSATQTTPQAN